MMVNAGKIWFVELFDCKLCLNSANILFSRCVQLCYSKRLCLSWMMNLIVQTARAAETFRELARPFEAAATFECNDSKNQTQNDNAQKTTWERTLRAVTCTRGCTRSLLSSSTESERRVWRIGFRKRMLFIWSLVLLRENSDDLHMISSSAQGQHGSLALSDERAPLGYTCLSEWKISSGDVLGEARVE